ncbi:MAG: hypothetical protein ACI8P0_005848, partial [Planctomycetaceae bacterium]
MIAECKFSSDHNYTNQEKQPMRITSALFAAIAMSTTFTFGAGGEA